MNLGHTQSCEGWRRRKPECPEGSIPQHLLVTSLAKESRALPISQAGTEPWSGIRSFITTPSLLLEKHCAQSPPQADRASPSSIPAPFPQGAAPARGLLHLPCARLPPRRKATVSSTCPEGKVVWAQVYPSLECYHTCFQ